MGLNRYSCAEHDIDYRISCDECNVKWAKFTKVMDASIDDNNSDEMEFV